MFWPFSRRTADITQFDFDFERAKKACRILIIDDHLDALPDDELKRSGYSIDHIQEVDGNWMNLCEDGTYDIIFLDYFGVAPPTIAPNDGFGVFDRIRAKNPNQYIIAISAQAFDISKTAYLKNANDWLKKPIDLATTKQVIDVGVRQCFNKNLIIDEIRNTLKNNGISEDKIEKAIGTLVKGKNEKKIIEELNKLLFNIHPIVGLVRLFVKAASL